LERSAGLHGDFLSFLLVSDEFVAVKVATNVEPSGAVAVPTGVAILDPLALSQRHAVLFHGILGVL
jgi:hypothetical protein